MGDTNGRIWYLEVDTGKITIDGPSKGTGPLIDVGKDSANKWRPIMASVSIGEFDSREVIGYGTGGADWSASTENFVAIYDLKDDTELVRVEIGSLKVYSPVVFAGGTFFFSAVAGTLNSADPTVDLLADNNPGDTYLYQVYKDPSLGLQIAKIKVDKTASSVFVDNGQPIVSDLEGKMTRFGKKKDQKGLDLLKFLYWKVNQ